MVIFLIDKDNEFWIIWDLWIFFSWLILIKFFGNFKDELKFVFWGNGWLFWFFDKLFLVFEFLFIVLFWLIDNFFWFLSFLFGIDERGVDFLFLFLLWGKFKIKLWLLIRLISFCELLIIGRWLILCFFSNVKRVKILGIFDSWVVFMDLIIIWVMVNLFRGVLIEVNCIKFFLVNILIICFKDFIKVFG